MDKCNEISNRIQQEIKTKLSKLIEYVDNELPDYIMIMIANQKSEAQMTEALSLFLGDKTVAFTKWLYELLIRLRSNEGGSDISVDKEQNIKVVESESKKKNVEEKKNVSEAEETDFSGINVNLPDLLDVEYIEENISTDLSIESKDIKPETKPKENKLVKEKQPAKGSSHKVKVNEPNNKSVKTVESPEKDKKKSNVLEASKVVKNSDNLNLKQSPKKSSKPAKSSVIKINRNRKYDADKSEENKKIEVQAVKKVEVSKKSGVFKRLGKSVSEEVDNKKKKIITSSVNVVKRKSRKTENDEPLTPSVGSKVSAVASKKPKFAPHQRANTVLLLKAISEATEGNVKKRIKVVKNVEPKEVEENIKDEVVVKRNVSLNDSISKATNLKMIKNHILKVDQRSLQEKATGKRQLVSIIDKKVKNDDEEVRSSSVYVDPKRIKRSDLKINGKQLSSLNLKKTVDERDENQEVAPKSTGPCFIVTLNNPIEKLKFNQSPDSTTARTSFGFESDAHATSSNDIETIKSTIQDFQEQAQKLRELQEKLFPGSLEDAPKTDLLPTASNDSCSIHIANIHFSASEKQLAEHFSVCGKVKRVTILKDHYTGYSKGFAYLEFEEEGSVESALAFHNTEFCSRNIMVTKKKPTTNFSKFSRPRPPFRYFPRTSYYPRPRPFRGFNQRPRLPNKKMTWVKPGFTPFS